MKYQVTFWLIVIGSLLFTSWVAIGNNNCIGVFEEPDENLPSWAVDPNNQIRGYYNLRTGQKLDLTFTACDVDGDPIGTLSPFSIPSDVSYMIQGSVITLQYHAKGQSKRDLVAFTLIDAPLDPNIIPASRVSLIVVDVHKNRAPVWR